MPIYEFKCSKCDEFFEILVMKSDDEAECKCPKCNSPEFERVLSSTNYSMGSSPKAQTGTSSTVRKCPSGSCTTYNIPGCG